MTSFPPSQPSPDEFPQDLNYTESVNWVGQRGEDPTFPEGAWSNHAAEVAEVLRPGSRYQVRYEATYWTAVAVESSAAFQPGDRVAVLGRKGNELLIGPPPSPNP